MKTENDNIKKENFVSWKKIKKSTTTTLFSKKVIDSLK